MITTEQDAIEHAKTWVSQQNTPSLKNCTVKPWLADQQANRTWRVKFKIWGPNSNPNTDASDAIESVSFNEDGSNTRWA